MVNNMTEFCGLILCAGYGNRLQQTEHKVPKPMISLNGKTIIEHIIDNFIRNGIEKIVFVLGYKNPILMNYLEQLKKKYLENHKEISFFYKTNDNIERENGYSAFLGLQEIEKLDIGDKIVLSMGDHLYSEKFIEKLIKKNGEWDIIVGADCFYKDEKIVDGSTTKLFCENNKVIAIGKDLDKFNKIDTGIFLVKKSVLKMAKEVERKGDNFGWTDIIKMTMKKNLIVTFSDFDNIPWFNINYKQDLVLAKEIIKKGWFYKQNEK